MSITRRTCRPSHARPARWLSALRARTTSHERTAEKLIVVRGGEDDEFGALSLRVIPSLHGVLRRAPFLRRDPNAPPPKTAIPGNATAPLPISDFAEGGTLAY